jgi:hypothetical protein
LTYQKRVLIEFDEQSKSVVSKVSVEYTGEDLPSNEDILAETKILFLNAQKYALERSMPRAVR